MQRFTGAIIRLHAPLTLRLWDAFTGAAAMTFLILTFPFVLHGQPEAALVSSCGGALMLWRRHCDQRMHEAAVWEMACASDNPVETLALHEYLYRARFRDLLVLAKWREEREAAGLPVLVDDPTAPRQVRALMEYLRPETGPDLDTLSTER